jgi:hypothetical protein
LIYHFYASVPCPDFGVTCWPLGYACWLLMKHTAYQNGDMISGVFFLLLHEVFPQKKVLALDNLSFVNNQYIKYENPACTEAEILIVTTYYMKGSTVFV